MTVSALRLKANTCKADILVLSDMKNEQQFRGIGELDL